MTKVQVKAKKDEAALERRREAGVWLRSLREQAGLSQRDLARATGVEHYPFIAQIEHGVGRVPAERFGIWAQALAVEPRSFTIKMMSYYDRALYDLLFAEGQVALAVSARGGSQSPLPDDDLVPTAGLVLVKG